MLRVLTYCHRADRGAGRPKAGGSCLPKRGLRSWPGRLPGPPHGSPPYPAFALKKAHSLFVPAKDPQQSPAVTRVSGRGQTIASRRARRSVDTSALRSAPITPPALRAPVEQRVHARVAGLTGVIKGQIHGGDTGPQCHPHGRASIGRKLRQNLDPASVARWSLSAPSTGQRPGCAPNSGRGGSIRRLTGGIL